jgi:hypothetical protein
VKSQFGIYPPQLKYARLFFLQFYAFVEWSFKNMISGKLLYSSHFAELAAGDGLSVVTKGPRLLASAGLSARG